MAHAGPVHMLVIDSKRQLNASHAYRHSLQCSWLLRRSWQWVLQAAADWEGPSWQTECRALSGMRRLVSAPTGGGRRQSAEPAAVRCQQPVGGQCRRAAAGSGPPPLSSRWLTSGQQPARQTSTCPPSPPLPARERWRSCRRPCSERALSRAVSAGAAVGAHCSGTAGNER